MDVLEHEAVVPDVLVQLAVWVLSEYGYLSPTHALNQIADHLVMILEQAHQSAFLPTPLSPVHRGGCDSCRSFAHCCGVCCVGTGSETRCWIVSGLMKLVAQMNHCPPAIEEVVGKYKRSRHIDLQQVLAFAASPPPIRHLSFNLVLLEVLRVRGAHCQSRHHAYRAAH
jgi:hypothetical protein